MSSQHTNTSETAESAISDDSIIELTSVDFGYTTTPVVEDISLRIGPGEYAAVVGPNGSGRLSALYPANFRV